MSGTTNDGVVVLHADMTPQHIQVSSLITAMYKTRWLNQLDEGDNPKEIIDKWNSREFRWPCVMHDDPKSGSLITATTSHHANKDIFSMNEDCNLCMESNGLCISNVPKEYAKRLKSAHGNKQFNLSGPIATSTSEPETRTCYTCGDIRPSMPRCKGCALQNYYSEKCQRKDWKKKDDSHKEICIWAEKSLLQGHRVLRGSRKGRIVDNPKLHDRIQH